MNLERGSDATVFYYKKVLLVYAINQAIIYNVFIIRMTWYICNIYCLSDSYCSPYINIVPSLKTFSGNIKTVNGTEMKFKLVQTYHKT